VFSTIQKGFVPGVGWAVNHLPIIFLNFFLFTYWFSITKYSASGVTQVVEHLPNKNALSSNPSITQTNKQTNIAFLIYTIQMSSLINKTYFSYIHSISDWKLFSERIYWHWNENSVRIHKFYNDYNCCYPIKCINNEKIGDNQCSKWTIVDGINSIDCQIKNTRE
jgi:hypothetical protein